jgi:hypothetical protein
MLIGNPENGVRITRTPRRMRMLGRDMWRSISGLHNDDKFAANGVGMRFEMRKQFTRSA